MIKYILLACFLPVMCFGQSVSSVSGTVADGESVTISGSSFGTKPTAAPVAWDNLEDGTCNTTATVGTWSSTTLLEINSDNNRATNSSYNAYHDFDGNDGAEAYAVFRGGSDSPSWYVSYWFMLGPNWDWGTIHDSLGNIKILRMWTTGSDNENFKVNTQGTYDVLWNDEYCDPSMLSSSNGNSYMGWTNFENEMDDGEWHHIQFVYSESSGIGVADGTAEFYFDGDLIAYDYGIITDCGASGADSRPMIVGFYDSHAQTNNDGANDFYIDDVYIDNSWARVEIGDNATYANCTHREIQIPTAWSATSITIDANQGSFATDDAAYLFVVDADGNVSDGYAITIGASESASITAPTNLTATKVE